MGNCSTQSQHIVIPSQNQTPEQVQFIKPQPTVFTLPPSLLQHNDPTAEKGNLQKSTKISNIKNKAIEQSVQFRDLQMLKPGALFIDNIFKAQRKSIGDKFSIQNAQWRRPSQFLKQSPIVYQPQLDTFDLKQGRLQNSYFVSAFASLAYPLQRFQPIIQHILNQKTQVSKNGSYSINLFIQGNWKQIIIDDLFPVVYKQYIFSNFRSQLWIWFIEKAYAKIFKSYQNIQKGLIGVMLNALTGAPYQYLNTKSTQLISPDIAWQFVRNNMSNNYILTVSTQNVDRNKHFDLPSTFSYTVLDCQQVYILTTFKKKRQRILKLDNPWGRYQWKGRWSEYSDVWSQELRHQLDYQKADDSIMWINIEDLLKHFGQICVCKYNIDYINSSLNLHCNQQAQNSLKGVYINISTRTEGFLSLYQKDHRNYFKNHTYSMSKLILLHMDKQTMKPKQIIFQKIQFDYLSSIPIEFNPGLYYLIIEMEWTCSFTREIIVNFYSDHSVNIVQDPNMPSGQALFYQLALIDQNTAKTVEVYVYPHDENIKRVKGVFGGYVYYHYFNNSKDNRYLAQHIKLGDSKNLVVTGQKCTDQFAVKLLPGQQKLVKMKITKQGNGQYSFNPQIKNQVFQKFTNQSLLQMLKKKPTKMRQRDIENKKIQVFIKTFQYSGGIALLYVNQMSQHSYIQQIIFQINNLELDGQKLEEDNKYNIQLQPHSQKMLSFLVIDPSKSYSFKTKVQYYLGTPQFKF